MRPASSSSGRRQVAAPAASCASLGSPRKRLALLPPLLAALLSAGAVAAAPDLTPRERVAEAAALLNVDPSRAAALAGAAREEARRLRDRSAEAQALSVLATSDVALGKWSDALARADEGLALLGAGDDPRLAVALRLSRGAGLADLGRFAEAREAIDEATAGSRALAAPDLVARALRSRARLRSRLGDAAEAIRDGIEADEAAARSGDEALAAEVLADLGSLYDDVGEGEAALACFERALPVFERIGAGKSQAAVAHDVARIHLGRGKLDEAAASYHRSLLLSQKAGDESGIAYAELGLASVERRRGRPGGEALGRLRKCLATFERLGDARMRFAALVEIGRLERERGRPLPALLSLEQALSAASRLGTEDEIALACRELALTYASAKRWEEAYRSFLEAERHRDLAAESERRREATELGVRFATQLQRRENELLVRENEVGKLRLAEERGRRTLFALAAGAGLLLASLLTAGLLRDRRQRLLLAELARTDELTGLPNRRAALEALEREIHAADRYGGPLSLAILDLDRFKEVNDGLGHAAGDAVLVAFAGLCRSVLRREDLAARWGGEEFLVLLRQTAEPEARGVLERLREGTRAIRLPGADPVAAVTVSAGLTSRRMGELDADELLRRADVALYAAKAGGRDRVEVAPG